MYLDVHGLAFETSIYNRKDQSGICIYCISKNASCHIVNYTWDPSASVRAGNESRQSTEWQLRVAIKPTLAWTNHELFNTQSVDQLLRSLCREWALTPHTDNAFFGIILYYRDVLPSVNTSGQSASYCNSHYRELLCCLPLKYSVSPTEVELPLRLVLCACAANFTSASQHTPWCFQLFPVEPHHLYKGHEASEWVVSEREARIKPAG